MIYMDIYIYIIKGGILMRRYDAIIIGFGKGGKTLAVALSAQGLKVAMIEKSKYMYGGTCINIGCIPTKILGNKSNIAKYKEIKTFEQKEEEYKNHIKNKDEVVSFLRNKNFDNLDSKDNITIYTGKASFVSQHEVKVEMEDETLVISGENIFINTGATTIIPNIKGAKESKRIYTSTTIMNNSKLPKVLAVIGGGYIGLEFASMYSNFGSKVKVFEENSHLIPREDRDIAKEVKDVLEKKGIEFKMNIKIEFIKDTGYGVNISYLNLEDNMIYEVKADAILLATGRKPNIEGLNLENLGVKITESGAIKVDDKLKTSVHNIWAIGDVNGGPQFTYISMDDYRIIKDDLFGNKKRSTKDRGNIPYSVFMDPPLSRIGLSEEEAIKKGYEIKVAKLSTASIPRAILINETDGILKAVVDSKTNKILGCTMLCAESSEIINIVQIAMKADEDYTFLRDHIFTHPTMSESLNDLFSVIK